MASSVASPIERQLSTIAGISSMNSSSALGLTQITIQFDLGRNIDGAALDVQTALSVAAKNLPIEMTTPPSFRKVNPGDFPVLYVSMRSDTMPLSAVDDYAETVLAPNISQTARHRPGAGLRRAEIRRAGAGRPGGGRRTQRLARGHPHGCRASQFHAPVGTLQGQKQTVTLLATGAMQHAADYRNVVVAYRNGAPVKLSEVASVIDSVENDKIATWFNDSRAIVLAIQRQPDANTVEVVDDVRAKLVAVRGQVPPAIQMTPLFDRSLSIRAAVSNVQETLAIAICLVIMVIFLFLRKVSATIIPALAVPVSLIGTCAAMYAFGYSINNMTLLALTLSVGFVVDDAIVMLENIVRHVEGGMRPFEAALKGSREIGFTIVSITFSLIAVFIPVLLMGGMVGRVFREFAVTIAVAIITSGFVSLTLTPMLCARVLRGHHPGQEEKQNFVLRAFESLFERMKNTYEWSLDRVLAYKSIMLMVTLATIAGTIWLYIVVPKGFFPVEDTGYIIGITDANSDIAFPEMVEHQRKIADIVRKDPAVAYINSTVGAGGPNTLPNSGRMLVALKPRDERGSLQSIIARLRQESNIFPGMEIFFQPIQNINLGGKLAKSQYQYTLQSNDTEALYRIAPELRDKIAKLPGLLDVTTDLYVKNPQVTVVVDREKSMVYGVSIDQVRQQLYDAFGSRQVATIYTPANNYQVILETKPEFQSSPNDLDKVYLKTLGRHGGAVVGGDALRAHGRPTAGQPPGPAAVGHHLVQSAPDFSLGQAVDEISNLERQDHLPATITTGFQGTAQVFQDSLARAGHPDSGGDLRRLCGARHFVRKLHPPDHHHLRPAVGRHRRDPHLDAVQDGSVGDRHDRHRHAGRHRQEERDHDDRLRHRTPPRRPVGRGRDPRSGDAALPPDHDDDVRRDLRHAADRARHRRGRRTAPAARRRGGRRPAAVAAADALHHAGDLRLSRSRRPPDQASARTAARRSSGSAAGSRGGVGPKARSWCHSRRTRWPSGSSP